MRVWMERKIQIATYDMSTYGYEVTDVDVPAKPGETAADHENRMHLAVYAKMLAFEVYHRKLTVEQAKAEIKRFKQEYHIGNGSSPKTD